MNELEIRHLRCVVTLAEEKNFGRAAERLHMSQPPLTRLLAEVERIIGAKLFERTTRRVVLTPIGEVFVREARDVLARAESATEVIQAAVRRQAGLVRLAYTPLALQTVLPQLLTTFREREHDARVDLVELSGELQQQALAKGQIDLAFSSQPISDDAYQNVLLHRESLALLVPEGHRLVGSATISLKAIASDPLILHPRHEYPGYYDRVLAAAQADGWEPQIYHRGAGQNCAALVVGGQGVLLTSGPHTRLLTPGLRLVPLATTVPLYEEIWATWSAQRLSAQAKTLTGIVQAYATVKETSGA